MHDIDKKIALVFVPLVIGLIAMVAGYTAFNWLFVLYLEWIEVQEVFVEFVGPAVCSILMVYFGLRPSIKLLRLRQRQDTYFGIYIFIAILLFVPTVISQKLLATATGKLTKLTDISQYPTLPKTKYYTLDTFYLHQEKASFSYRRSVTGKRGNRLLFKMFCAIPILKTSKDTVNDSCWYYLCTNYTEEVSKEKEEERNNAAYRQFLRRSEKDFKAASFDDFTYLEALGRSSNRNAYREAVFYSALIGGDHPVLLVRRHTPYENRSDGYLMWLCIAIGVVLIAFLVMVFMYKFKPKASYVIKRKYR